MPVYLIISNGDVMKIRNNSKILRLPLVSSLSSDYKFQKVLLFHHHNSYEDLTEEHVELLFDDWCSNDEGVNIRVVEKNERRLFPMKTSNCCI